MRRWASERASPSVHVTCSRGGVAGTSSVNRQGPSASRPRTSSSSSSPQAVWLATTRIRRGSMATTSSPYVLLAPGAVEPAAAVPSRRARPAVSRGPVPQEAGRRRRYHRAVELIVEVATGGRLGSATDVVFEAEPAVTFGDLADAVEL